MPKCPHCGGGVPIRYRCVNCNSTWCPNGNCTGSSGKKQISRSNNALCQTCQKKGIQKI